ncbi:hypothetical protein [Nocardia aurantiaca]|uniref:Uncharacterized protein n=1 Tax=Nocardia aurantiaca TaxID=2675850 RepID=A0A6I3L8H3_9NOCA|nr:hypothetical protein [Nocardia aurantiaca]MTE17054.1 hypothetical protein [Nocardia aurantiaca]
MLAVAAILPAAPAAYAEIVLTDASQTQTTTSTTTTTPTPTTTPTTSDPAPSSPIEALVTGSSGFKLGGAAGSATTGSSGNSGPCTVLGTASALSGLAALGCGSLNGGTGIGPGTIG